MKRLQNKKVYVGKHSKEIQKIALALGFTWLGDKVVDFLNKPFLFFDHTHITYGADVGIFNSHEYEEITAEEILAMKVEYTFQPDQLVLVRCENGNKWTLNRYSYYEPNDPSNYFHVCYAGVYRQCIPYEGNEHLLGKTEKA